MELCRRIPSIDRTRLICFRRVSCLPFEKILPKLFEEQILPKLFCVLQLHNMYKKNETCVIWHMFLIS